MLPRIRKTAEIVMKHEFHPFPVCYSGVGRPFSRPLLTVTDFVSRTGIRRRTAERIVEELLAKKILGVHEAGAGRRPSIPAFTGNAAHHARISDAWLANKHRGG